MQWFYTERPHRPGWVGPARSPDPGQVRWSEWTDPAHLHRLPGSEDPVLLIRAPQGQAFLVDVGRARKLPEASSLDDVREMASAAAAVWWEEADRRDRTRERLYGLVDHGESVRGVRDPVALYRLLVQYGGKVVGAAGGAVVERIPGTPRARIAFPETPPSMGPDARWSPLLERRGVRRDQDVDGEGAGEDVMGRVARILGARYLVHHPVTPGCALLLAERRRSRVFDEEDWAVLQGLAQQTAAALACGGGSTAMDRLGAS